MLQPEPEAGHPSRWRRGIDATVAALSLVMLSPLLLLIALAIVIDDGGPVFFSQQRLGLLGVPFRLHKFRKFHVDERGAGGALTLRADPRLTRVGGLLERTKLDELPQLWNILRGEMALVGPRPESLHFADCFNGSFVAILEHRPGLFGPAQARFRNESAMYPPMCDPATFYRATLFPAKAGIDLAYYRSRSALGDLKWLLRSILAIFGGIWVAGKPAPHAARRSREAAPVTRS